MLDVLVAFLGAPQHYDDVTYVWEQKTFQTPYCPEALVHVLKPQRLVLLVTERARQAESYGRNNLQTLTNRVAAKGCRVYPVSIPDAPYPEEEFGNILWQLFEIVVAQIKPHEHVAFDITFGYRFLPILTVLVGQFLKFTREVETTGIYYGAREAENTQGHTPIVDLSGLTKVMAWTQAAAHFQQTGNAVPFLEQHEQQDDSHLSQVWQHLEAVSLGLRLGMASKVGQSVTDLLESTAALPESTDPALAPVHVLFEQITQKYSQLSIDNPFTIQYAQAHLRQQADLLDWYVENQLVLQATLLAREWFVTWVMVHSGVTDLLDWEARNHISYRLGTAAQLHNPYATYTQKNDAEAEKNKLRFIADLDSVLRSWSACTAIRNQMAHMSMDSRHRSIQELMQISKDIADTVRTLAAKIKPNK